MGSFLGVIPIVVRRVRANARLLAAVVIGAVLAAALMSTTSIYTDAIRDLGLSYAIRERGPDKINILVRQHVAGLERGDATARTATSSSRPRAQALWGRSCATGRREIGRSATFFPTRAGRRRRPADERRPRSHLQFVTNLEAARHGRRGPPAARRATPAPDGPAPTIEVAMGGETARTDGRQGRRPLRPASVLGAETRAGARRPSWASSSRWTSATRSGWA